ncbi:gliding motility-associated C-terminal domain-containing protein [Chryseolinea sp. T2]|uniref:T9SS type B sorting domain-containing protein n=1 Tax=Chryseolinea sp. T2 TaxID=3129255 RepID=UPI0030781E2A
MKRILLAILLLISLPSFASHIVGGEFEISHISGNSYRINLILYFDVLNGSSGARDNAITAVIYRKSDNALMRSVSFSNPAESPVQYTQPSCSHGEVVTTKMVYSTTVTLSDSQYSDPAGYYIIWERCCRNYTITNVYSNDPAVSSLAAGQTFYLEFPPVVKNGTSFINSTPHLFPPLSDYACPRKPYFVDFAGVDDDGDSLAYSLVTPLSTHTIDAFPPLLPRPYPEVAWRPPFSLNNIINGAPDLRISTDGLLTATPMQQGLFVFAVKCEEYRNGVKIGEVRRDFQMLVVDACPRAEPPQIKGRKLADATFSYDEQMSVTFANVPDADRCIEVEVSDPDALSPDDNMTENVRIKAIAIGFKKNVSDILPAQVSATLINGSTRRFQICFDECPLVNGPFKVGIVAFDDACSVPLSDTLVITVNIQPPPNQLAQFLTPDVEETVAEGTTKSWPIKGMDPDGDQLVVGVVTDNFVLADVGMQIVQHQLANGVYEAELIWDTHCDIADFKYKSEFNIKILLDDVDKCLLAQPDIMEFKLKVDLPPNVPPIIDSDLTANPAERYVTGITRKVNESLFFHVMGRDDDNDHLVLGGQGVGFTMADYNISFPGASGNGAVVSPFSWNVFCDNVDLKKRDQFTFRFILVDDNNRCKVYQADTLDVTVKLLPPDNDAPTLQITSLEKDMPMTNGGVAAMIGQQITLGLSATDPDVAPQADMLHLDLIDVQGGADGYIFEAADGRRSVSSTFAWLPECKILGGEDEASFTFTFNVTDDRCWSQKGDTVAVDVTVHDVDRDDEDFLPPNIITPNGDDKNDFFAMVREDPITHELVNILPTDNCDGHFEGIFIVNRWGMEVYNSSDRDFRWYADNQAAGVYFYTLKYSDRDYKGTVSVAYFEDQAKKN